MTRHNEDNSSLRTQKDANDGSKDTCASVNAGVCGFTCRIRVWKTDKRAVGLAISESDCQQIQRFSEDLKKLTNREDKLRRLQDAKRRIIRKDQIMFTVFFFMMI